MRPSLTPVPLGVEPMTRSILFEGLFVHGLPRNEAFEAELRQAGFDRGDLLPQYPLRLFRQCMDIACRHFYPGLPVEEGRRKLGHHFVQGFTRTVLGGAVAVGMPLIGPVRFLKKFPEHLRFDTSPILVQAVEVGERSFRMEFRTGVGLSPHFLRGMLEEGLRMTRVNPTLRVVRHSPISFDLHITW
ncbi:DUF2378 family protein [Hyalangium rubrum]|uniref:DUF2378 family protein n=1 Tax=Hyalangium rubrum TaxID=3103134 RepID=A0ABU5HFN1_9BACT|nr:DUF2378 family protein [Hyalangium sp. s54d21]MDY7232263.1 DUF2378 family protein [Hyalangium sp. s54d21]